ncbi:hypothetical protein like AT5G22400 [Hibiscus trionum]|uniref:Uncharacterized protein n=1 Tax=Hibiscus trionum TaxID=183268 RepID=A0A9W7IG71_HIBTR|nr:hypothetical protein like AT5G22400 [Hibiscus trionum]
MPEVLHFPSSQSTNNSSSAASSSSSSASSSSSPEDALSCSPRTTLTCAHGDEDGFVNVTGGGPGRGEKKEAAKNGEKQKGDQLSLLALLVTFCRKSLTSCRRSDRRQLRAMEVGWPTNVRHVAHVTFDRFHGFLGLPVEFEPEVPRRAPSASTSVFGVSTESMQLSYDSRGNSVPTILLLMQCRLYAQGGLQTEGIFRINGENSLEEYVREKLNDGVVPEGVDAHCLAGLIKAWFRELPSGVLDSLNPEQVMQCQTEEQCVELARLLPPTEYALLDWAINLMADVVEHEHLNKMNEHNIAVVFAPNMTRMDDPLTALMYAVQVMKFLKTLILRTVQEREPFNGDTDQRISVSCIRDIERGPPFIAEEPLRECLDGDRSVCKQDHSKETPAPVETFISEKDTTVINNPKCGKSGKVPNKIIGQQPIHEIRNPAGKTKEICNLSRVNSRVERIEAWR